MSDDDILARWEADFAVDPRAELLDWFGDELVDAGIATIRALVSDRWGQPGAPVSVDQLLAFWALLDDDDRRMVRGRAHAELRAGIGWPLMVDSWLEKVARDQGRDHSGLSADQRGNLAALIWDSTPIDLREQLVDAWHVAGQRARDDQ